MASIKEKKNQNKAEIATLTDISELQGKLKTAREGLLQSRLDISIGKEKNKLVLGEKRKQIARLLTRMNQLKLLQKAEK